MADRLSSRWSNFGGKKYSTTFNFEKTFHDNFFSYCMENTFVKCEIDQWINICLMNNFRKNVRTRAACPALARNYSKISRVLYTFFSR